MKRPLVVKFGSSLVLDHDVVSERAGEIGELARDGTPVCIVSSGAVALGLRSMNVERRPRSLPRLQAASALGQPLLQRRWEDAFTAHGVRTAQVLLTAAEVAVLVRAQLLVLLTSVEGVFDAQASLIPDGAVARAATFRRGSDVGKGGMESKVAAAGLAAAAGIPSVIASGTEPLPAVLAGGGTRFEAAATGESAFKLWLRFGKRVTGRLIVDDGAQRAVRGRGSSLLAVGVVRCEGSVHAGDGVELCGLDGTPFGRGISSLDARELEARPSNVEAVHRDRLILY